MLMDCVEQLDVCILFFMICLMLFFRSYWLDKDQGFWSKRCQIKAFLSCAVLLAMNRTTNYEHSCTSGFFHDQDVTGTVLGLGTNFKNVSQRGQARSLNLRFKMSLVLFLGWTKISKTYHEEGRHEA